MRFMGPPFSSGSGRRAFRHHALDQLNLSGVVEVVRGGSRDEGRPGRLAAGQGTGKPARVDAGDRVAHGPVRGVEPFQASSLTSEGSGNQLEPFRANDRLRAPVRALNTAYFQYAAWTAISQMLWRLLLGRQRAWRAVRPRRAPRRFVPCQDFRS